MDKQEIKLTRYWSDADAAWKYILDKGTFRDITDSEDIHNTYYGDEEWASRQMAHYKLALTVDEEKE